MKNSIEEDIKTVENYLENSAINEIDSNFFKNGGWETVDLEIPKSMQHILSDYKRVLKENEELKFKERSRIIGKYGDVEIHDLINRTLSNDYISVQKVKDNLIKYQEEYELLLEHQSGKESNRTKYLRGRIHMCQELLEGRK